MSLEPPDSPAGRVIWVVCVLAVLAIGRIAVGQLGIPIPGWVVSMFWVVLVACGAILAIRAIARA